MKKLILGFAFVLLCCNNATQKQKTKDYSKYHNEALEFCKSKKLNTAYYFLLDMSIHSGRNRFFVYDFDTNKVTDKNLVTHGSCDQFQENEDKWEKAKFDSRIDSHCTMKGKYKIGERAYSSWGIHIKYVLHGLESSNKNAEKRYVVLHSWNAVSNTEIYPEVSPLSWGCPAVSNEFMKKIDTKLKASKKPVLLWIVE